MRYRRSEGQGSRYTAYSWLSVALVAAGIALRLWQYVGRSSLWTDEATLANNIVARSYGRLMLEPLGHNQAAPPGFLIVEKAAVTMFGVNELALRAFPFACSIIALVLVWRLAARLVSAESAPLALAPFALAPPIIFFAADAKQYSSDVAIALALLLYSLALAEGALTRRRAIVAALTGVCAVWLSQPAVLVLAGIGVVMLVQLIHGREQPERARIAAVVGAWAVGAAAVVAVSFHHLASASRRYMYVFWSDGFWPLAPMHLSSWTWPMLHGASLLGGQLALPTSVGAGGVLLAVVGTVSLWQRDRFAAMLVVAPVLIALGASAAQLYPFAGRLALFLVAPILLLAAAGLEAIVASIPRAQIAAATRAMAALFLLAMSARALRASPPVYRPEEISPALDYLRHAAKSSDATYVHYGAVPAFQFYESLDAIPGSTVLGECHRADLRAYLAELDSLRGRARTWVLFGHELPRLRERELMVRYLEAIGRARDSVVSSGRDVDGNVASERLYLFDLSDSTRLGAASAASFPIAPQLPLEAKFACGPVDE